MPRKVWVTSAERSPVSCSDFVVDFRILRRWRPSRNQASGMNSRIDEREMRIHVEHGGDEDDDLEIVLAERDDGAARRLPDEIGVVEEADTKAARNAPSG